VDRAAKRWAWTVGAVVAAGLVFRVLTVSSWRAPAGDGLQYHALSQELILRGRYALGPPPKPLTYVRMPGYPLFLAYVAVRQAPLGLGPHLVRATLANVVLDALTALLVFSLLRRFGRRVALTGLVATFLCPLLLLLSCYGLTETLATFLATLEVWLALRAQRSRLVWHAAACGVVAGLAQLVRNDAVTAAPAVALALWWAVDGGGGMSSLRRRAGAAALAAALALAVFAPWPLRNLRQFGAAHAGATFWRAIDGTPLPTEIIDWERTWSSSAPGESYLDVPIVFNQRLDPRRPGIVMPQMYDDEAERRRIVAVFDRYDRERWSPAVNAELAALARERRARHPWRTFVGLPLRRVAHLFLPVPEWELPMRSSLLHLPQLRFLFGWWDALAYLCALGGVVVLVRRGRDERRLAAVLGSWVLARCLVFSWAIPNATTQRYLVECMPALLAFAAVGVDAAYARGGAALRTRWSPSRRSRSAGATSLRSGGTSANEAAPTTMADKSDSQTKALP
jgi:hypothetical protein